MGKLFTQGWYDRVEALLALARSSAAAVSVPLRNRVISPNGLGANDLGNITPGASTIIAVVDITPQASGLLYVAGYLETGATSAGTDRVSMDINGIPTLTGITGGVLVAPGLTLAQGAAITGVAGGAPQSGSRTFVESAAPAGTLTGAWTMAFAFPFQATPGDRTGLEFLLTSGSNRTFDNLTLCLSVTEQP